VAVGGQEIEYTLPKVAKPTQVLDFRYRRANSTRIYRRAKYALQPGEEWKSGDDAALLAEVENHLKKGPRYDSFVQNRKHKLLLVWTVLCTVALAPLLILLRRQNRKRT